MADAWNGAWADAWGVSWGTAAAVVTPTPSRTAGGGAMPRFPEDTGRRERERKSARHLRRSVEIATEGRIISPDLMLDDSELVTEEEAVALLVVGLLE